jgi:uncharacterized membrane protein YbhN (UPF0104 family)
MKRTTPDFGYGIRAFSFGARILTESRFVVPSMARRLGGHIGRTVWRSIACWHWLGLKRHPLVVVAASAAVSAGAATLLFHLARHGKIWQHLGTIEPTWFLVCAAGQGIAYLGYVLALHETARVDGGPRLGFGLAARVVAAGFGAFFAASAAGGFEVDYWALRRAGASRRESLSRVLGLGTLEYAVLAPAALAAALALLAGAGHERYPALTLPWLLVIPGFLFAAWVTSPKRRDRLEETRGRGRARTAFGHMVSGLGVLRMLFTRPLPHGLLAFAGTATYWFGEILCLWASLRAFQADVRIPALILAYATGYVVTRRALPAGGVGVAEIALTFSLVWLGVPFVPALLGVFSYRIFNFWLALLPALAVGGTMRKIREGLPGTRRELAEQQSRG